MQETSDKTLANHAADAWDGWVTKAVVPQDCRTPTAAEGATTAERATAAEGPTVAEGAAIAEVPTAETAADANSAAGEL
ncbi:unnamed protein product [Closterium sp. NIES-54]